MLNKPLICRPVCFSQFLYMGSNIVNEHPYMLYHWAQLLLFLWDTVFEIMHQRNEHFRAMNIWCILSGYSLEMLHILYSQQQSVRLPLSWWLLSLRSIFLFLLTCFYLRNVFLRNSSVDCLKILLVRIRLTTVPYLSLLRAMRGYDWLWPGIAHDPSGVSSGPLFWAHGCVANNYPNKIGKKGRI